MASCLSFNPSGVTPSSRAAGLVLTTAFAGVDELISSKDTVDETAELAGVLKFFEAKRTFQNCLSALLTIYTHLRDHIALGMPAFVPSISVHLDELLEDRSFATDTFDGKAGGIVIMTIW